MCRAIWLALVIFAPACLAAAEPQTSQPQQAAGLELFEKKIRPALIQYCYECHSVDADEPGGNLLLDSRDALLAGGEGGPAVVPGKPQQSLLLAAVEYRDLEMPPDARLPDEVISDFRRWIALGAPDPRDDAPIPPATQVDAASQPSATAKPLWSLHPVVDPPVPMLGGTDWPRIAADHFVLSRLRQAGLAPNADADPATLIRRLAFDLVGLPPDPQTVAAFAADPSQSHLAEIVDQYLGSPQFGERWGRHWLDVARYGESAGSSRDVLILYAWRYRDYVIDAFNADLPLDRFVVEQIAGDLLAAESIAERDRLRVATGLLAIGSKSLNGGNLTYDVIDDQIDVVSRSVLGLTVSCARCHDHKFDPVPTADYYALAGIFLSTDTRYGGEINRPKTDADKAGVYLTLGPLGDPDSPQAKQQAEQRQQIVQLEKQIAAGEKQIKTLTKQVPKAYRDAPDRPLADDLDPQTAKRIGRFRQVSQQLAQQTDALAAARASLGPPPEYAVGVRDANQVTDSPILIRGEKNQRGDLVPRGFLSCLGDLSDAPSTAANATAAVDASAVIDDAHSGRLQLARWLVDPRNPLTPRVAVNRIWQHLFGTGLVATVDNFGTSGLPPTNPQLLDHLAHRFVHTHRWSTKAMIRELVLSRTYGMSSNIRSDAYAVDPDNDYLWRMPRRRLEAEPLRDAVLAVSGLLKIDRPTGSLVMQMGEGEVGRNLNTAVLDQPFDHRSVYLPIIRGLIPEGLHVFDFPEPSNVQGLRDANTTPTQALYLMNSPFAVRAAEHFAGGLLDDPQLTDDRQRIDRAYQLCFSHAPTPLQTQTALAFIHQLGDATAALADDPAERRRVAWSAYCQTLFASAPFRFID